MAHDRVGKAGPVGQGLHPGHLVHGARWRPVGLHVDGFLDAAPVDVAQIFLDRVVAPDRLVGAEDTRARRPREPRQVPPPPDVMMRVDDPLHGGRRARLRPGGTDRQ